MKKKIPFGKIMTVAGMLCAVAPLMEAKADIVFDPSNFAQNSLTAVHMAESLVNQAQQIANQMKELEKLGYSSSGILVVFK